MVTKALGIADIVVGFLAFVFEISFLATCNLCFGGYCFVCTGYLDAASGIWGGIIFMITGVVAWKKASTGDSHKTLALVMACLSLACGIVLLGLTASAINDFTAPLYSSDIFQTQVALESILLICGVSAIVINGLLLYFTAHA